MHTPIMKIARAPHSVPVDSTAQDAVNEMVNGRVGAVAVLDGEDLVGIFTERDLMTKIVHAGKIAAETPLRDVMASDLVRISPNSSRGEALDIMIDNHFRHLPVTENGKLVGMLSLRLLLKHQLRRLKNDLRSLEQYIAADGPGG